MTTVSETDLRVLRFMQDKPRGSFAELGRELGVSPPTARSRVESLRDRGILRKNTADYSPEALGLVRFHALFKVSTTRNLENLEQALYIHPHTHYRGRLYGEGIGLLSQFDIPKQGKELLVTFFDRLANLGIIERYTLSRSTGIRASTTPNLDVWDPRNSSWEWDWRKWENALDNPDQSIRLLEPKPSHEPFDPLTLSLLKALTTDADVKQSDLVAKLDASKSDISRKMKHVSEHLVSSIRANFDRRVFDLNSYKLIRVKANDIEQIHALVRTLCGPEPPPFLLNIDLVEDGFFMVTNLPAFHESQLVYAIANRFSDLTLHTLDVVADAGFRYSFYEANYDFGTSSWKSSREYMLDHPLRELEKQMLKH